MSNALKTDDLKTLSEIKEILLRHKTELKEKFKIKSLGIFGSYARGEQQKNSDVDLLVEFLPEAKISLLDFVSIERYLSEMLDVKVDLVEESSLKPEIGKRILKEVDYL